MANSLTNMIETLGAVFGDRLISCQQHCAEVTIEVKKDDILDVCKQLHDHDDLAFEQLIDLTVVDYVDYGQDEWATESATNQGFSRGREQANSQAKPKWKRERFAVVYHLLSIAHNRRLRVKSFVKASRPTIDSVIEIWNAANWFEREAFDLFGILFKGHPDLRRLLSDYGFVGHPFRKDFPLIGRVELRYDAKQKRCVYEPVSIEPRVLVPRVIRAEKDDTIYVAAVENRKNDENKGAQ